ncbi:hypothetical protein BT63DRAFT_421244 [Microthyrium microscopicum]|uniref:ATP-dependent DNA ligase family profile domain-containing protein n=1 Tax=Microthyrium microscopicum TaxID=703497 RepID=A0A6A6ULD4_9PEZI|nr:hypothetical protein BT63DRAFT_421244 [Microthyrium microscopicum]
MAFQFKLVCELLTSLEAICTRDPPLLPKDREQRQRDTIDKWFTSHRKAINAQDTNGEAFLSCLLPERRTDRVYGLQEPRLIRVLPRSLRLGAQKTLELQDWNKPGNGDLGACIERVLKVFDAEPKAKPPVTIELIDQTLLQLASQCRFSSPEVRKTKTGPSQKPDELLGQIYLRLSSSEAKWMTRLILKNFSPVVLNDYIILRNYHFLLPDLLRFQDNFSSALALLRGPLAPYDAAPSFEARKKFRQEAAKHLEPQIGVKVGRPNFFKARSLDHCVKMTKAKRWSIERKYDGEYCEIHIDLDSGNPIQIFSKSGKDSTQDRQSAHLVIRDALRLGQPDCIFKKRCIVLGELVVFSDDKNKILEFHHIRKHVFRSGRRLGVDQDSFPEADEHLMVIFFDVLLLDENITMTRPHSERRQTLKALIQKKPGRAITSEWKIHDFSTRQSGQVLAYQFIDSVARRMEGLVLKPTDAPYFPLSTAETGEAMPNYYIKLKKDYMNDVDGERDEADFAVIGASFDPKLANQPGVKGLKWTTFYLGCTLNPDELRFGTSPNYQVVGCINCDQCIPKNELQTLNSLGQFRLADEDNGPPFNYTNSAFPGMTSLFADPFVVEVLGSSFVKPSNASFYMLRHPRILRVHLDRTWKNAVTFKELQEQAREALSSPKEGESQEMDRIYQTIKSRYNAKREKEQLSQISASTPQDTPSRTSVATTTPPGSTQSKRRSPLKFTQSPILVREDTNDRLAPLMHLNISPATAPKGPNLNRNGLKENKPLSNASNSQKSQTVPASKRKLSQASPEKSPLRKRAKAQTKVASPRKTWPALPSPEEGYCKLCKIGALNCPLANSVVYVDPSQATAELQLALRLHGAVIVNDLEALARETFTVEYPTSVIPESPAYPDKHLLVLCMYTSQTKMASIVAIAGIRERMLFLEPCVASWVGGPSEELPPQLAEKLMVPATFPCFEKTEEMYDCYYLGYTAWDADTDKIEFTSIVSQGFEPEWLDFDSVEL